MENIKKAYEEVRIKFNLPEFDELDKEFEINSIEDEKFLARRIIEKITERLSEYSCLIEGILQPDSSSVKSMIETTFYDDNEKSSLYKIYKDIMIILKDSQEIHLLRNEKEEMRFISESSNKWKNIKVTLQPLIRKLKKYWLEDKINTEKLGYLG